MQTCGEQGRALTIIFILASLFFLFTNDTKYTTIVITHKNTDYFFSREELLYQEILVITQIC